MSLRAGGRVRWNLRGGGESVVGRDTRPSARPVARGSRARASAKTHEVPVRELLERLRLSWPERRDGGREVGTANAGATTDRVSL